MSVCIMYILLGGGVFLTPGCVVDQGVVYPDEIQYVSHLPQSYSYAPIHQSTYRPRVVYSPTWRYSHRGYYGTRYKAYPKRWKTPFKRRPIVQHRTRVKVKPRTYYKVKPANTNKKHHSKKKHKKNKKRRR